MPVYRPRVFFGTLDGTLHAVDANQCGYGIRHTVQEPYGYRHGRRRGTLDSCDEVYDWSS